MELSFWDKTSGTWINAGAVLLGSLLGLLLGGRMPLTMRTTIVQGVGLAVLYIGISMAGALAKAKGGMVDGVVLALLAVVLGGVTGELLHIEEGLEALGEKLKKRFAGGGRFTEGFVMASLLFCAGPMTLIGSLQNGLTGDSRLLLLKSALDGLSSIAFASTYGMGVGFSVLIILLYQGGVSLAAASLAGSLTDPATDPQVLLVTGTGGLLILGIGINLLGLAKIRVGSYLPGLIVVLLLFWLAEKFS